MWARLFVRVNVYLSVSSSCLDYHLVFIHIQLLGAQQHYRYITFASITSPSMRFSSSAQFLTNYTIFTDNNFTMLSLNAWLCVLLFTSTFNIGLTSNEMYVCVFLFRACWFTCSHKVSLSLALWVQIFCLLLCCVYFLFYFFSKSRWLFVQWDYVRRLTDQLAPLVHTNQY